MLLREAEAAASQTGSGLEAASLLAPLLQGSSPRFDALGTLSAQPRASHARGLLCTSGSSETLKNVGYRMRGAAFCQRTSAQACLIAQARRRTRFQNHGVDQVARMLQWAAYRSHAACFRTGWNHPPVPTTRPCAGAAIGSTHFFQLDANVANCRASFVYVQHRASRRKTSPLGVLPPKLMQCLLCWECHAAFQTSRIFLHGVEQQRRNFKELCPCTTDTQPIVERRMAPQPSFAKPWSGCRLQQKRSPCASSESRCRLYGKEYRHKINIVDLVVLVSSANRAAHRKGFEASHAAYHSPFQP